MPQRVASTAAADHGGTISEILSIALTGGLAFVGIGGFIALEASSGSRHAGLLMSLVGGVAAAAASLFIRRLEREREAAREQQAAAALRRSQQFAAAQSSLISMVRHELLTPLQVIMTNVEYVEHSTPRNDDTVDAIARVHRATALIDSRLKNLAEYALATAEQTTRSDVFVLRQVLLRVVEDHRAKAEQRGQTIFVEFESGTEAPMRGDPARMTQIVSHYVHNAIQHGASHDAILVRTRFIGGRAATAQRIVEVEVVDRGPGIASAVQHDIWEPFVTTNRHVGFDAGSGLGLALVKLLADCVDWDVGVRPTQGGGATFFLQLPVSQLDGDVATTVAAASATAGPAFLWR